MPFVYMCAEGRTLILRVSLNTHSKSKRAANVLISQKGRQKTLSPCNAYRNRKTVKTDMQNTKP